MAPLTKPSRTARKSARDDVRRERVNHEKTEKAKVVAAMPRCRVPMCGCYRLRRPLEVSHQTHKGMGGNPRGDRSMADQMIRLCIDRHQDSVISRHRGTFAIEPLTPEGTFGPVRFWIDVDYAIEHTPVGLRETLEGLADNDKYPGLVPIATERAPYEWVADSWQFPTLEILGRMLE